jgi:hypothetical protein
MCTTLGLHIGNGDAEQQQSSQAHLAQRWFKYSSGAALIQQVRQHDLAELVGSVLKAAAGAAVIASRHAQLWAATKKKVQVKEGKQYL